MSIVTADFETLGTLHRATSSLLTADGILSDQKVLITELEQKYESYIQRLSVDFCVYPYKSNNFL